MTLAPKSALPRGKIEIAPRALASIGAEAVIACEGVVGLAPHTLLEEAAQVLGLQDFDQGVEVQISDDSLIIDLYVILEYGSPITEVINRAQEHVAQAFIHALGTPIAQVAVHVQGVQSS